MVTIGMRVAPASCPFEEPAAHRENLPNDGFWFEIPGHLKMFLAILVITGIWMEDAVSRPLQVISPASTITGKSSNWQIATSI